MDYQCDEMLQEAPEQDDFDVEQLQIIEYIANNRQDLIEQLTANLSETWTWDRISFVDRGIMLTAMAEVIVLKTPKVIAIDQALISAKQMNVDDSYKYINAVLDKVIK